MMPRNVGFLVAYLGFTVASSPCVVTSARPVAAAPPLRDVVFAAPESHRLRLDLFLPEDTKNPPLVVFIHGGGWRNNSYKRCLTPWLTDYGFAVASIGYRLSDKAKFPAQVHDCKAALRWLRAHADQYGYNADRIGVAGTSAGGHLALMLGVTGGVDELEGEVGGNAEQSSRVQAIVDYYGPSDFVLRSQNQPSKTEKPDSPVRQLLGVPASENKDLAKFASPAFHVTGDDPPLLIIHGDGDKTVHLDQSERMVEEYRRAGLDVTLEIVPGGGHGGAAHFTPVYRKKVADFLRSHLQPFADKKG
jgi:acetyl esterase/lipase